MNIEPLIDREKLDRFFTDLTRPFGDDPLRQQALALIRDIDGVVIGLDDAYQPSPERRIITITFRPKDDIL